MNIQIWAGWNHPNSVLYKIRRYFFFLAVVTIGVVLSITAFISVQSNENHTVQDEFKLDAQDKIQAIRNNIEVNLEVIHSIRSFYASSQAVEIDEFHTFAAHALSTSENIQALEWIPRVTASQRAEFEDMVRSEAYPDFQIVERQDQGTLVPAGSREEYFPVYYLEPLQGNEAALGFDLASSPARLIALSESRDTGESVATSRITLVQETGDQFGFLVFLAIYRNGFPVETVAQRRENLTGFVLGVYRIGDIVKSAIEPGGLDEAGLDPRIHIYDRSAPLEQQVLFGAASSTADKEEAGSVSRFASTVSVGGRQWEIVVTSVASPLHWQPWAALAGGLLLTGLLSAYILAALRRTTVVERLVGERTIELWESNQQLEDEVFERKLIEAELQRSEAGTRAILDTTVDGIMTIDARGLVESFNAAAEQIFGYSAAEIVGEDVEALMPEPNQNAHNGSFGNYLRTGKGNIIGVRREVVGRRKTGTEFPMELAMSEVRLDDRKLFTGIVRDITDQKWVHESLRKSNEQNQALINAIPDLMFRLNSEGVFLYYKAAKGVPLQVSPGSFVGHQVGEVLPPELAQLCMTNIKQALDTGEVAAFEYQLDLDGGAFDFEARATKYGEQEVLLIIRDITERKAVEQMKSRLVSVVSHELRTPLTSIKGYAELLLQEQDVSGEERELFLNIINQEADRLTSLINDFLDIARIESGRVQWRDEHVSIGEVMGTCATTMRVLAERKGQRLKLQIPPDLPPAWCDRERLSQVITNLLSNAVKFTPEDGSIEVTVGARGESDGGNMAQEILVEVSDSGIGISPEDHEKIFDRFGQVGGGEGSPGGTGLGLAITKEIVERH